MNRLLRVCSLLLVSVLSGVAQPTALNKDRAVQIQGSVLKVSWSTYGINAESGEIKKVNNQQNGNSSNFTGKYSPGRFIYKSRCTLCHGSDGKGDGRMALVITDPPPFDLSKSVANKEDTIRIIKEGGKSVGRSPQMPPWAKELSDEQIDSLVAYLFTFRK